MYDEECYVSEKVNAEYIATIDKVISSSYNKQDPSIPPFGAPVSPRDEELKDPLDHLNDKLTHTYEDGFGNIKVGPDFSLLQSDKLEVIGGQSDDSGAGNLSFLSHPRLNIEDHYLKTDVTLLTLMAQLSVHLGDLIHDLKHFMQIYEDKIERSKSDSKDGCQLNELQPYIQKLTMIYGDCNIYLKNEIIGRVFLSLREMVHINFDFEKFALKAGHSFGNVVSRELTFYKLHLDEIFGENDLRVSYIMSFAPRLISRIFRTNLKFIKNKEINQNGWQSLKNTFDSMVNTIMEQTYYEYSQTLSNINQAEISKTKYFIHLLSLEKKQLLLEIKENVHG